MNSFNSELQLKNAESTIKDKLKDLISELRWFKFVAKLVIGFKRQKVMMQKNIDSKAETIINESDVDGIWVKL